MRGCGALEAGEKKVLQHPELRQLFSQVVSGHIAGCPMREEVRWTGLKTRDIQDALAELGVSVSGYIVRQLAALSGLGQRQMTKTVAGHEFTPQEEQQRDLQFHNIKALVDDFTTRDLPVLSIDTKKKEFLGPMFRAGTSYCAASLAVYDHDYPSLATGVVIPHGLFDVRRNRGYISLGCSRDTSEFLCDNLRHHWNTSLKQQYAGATQMLLLMDGGGSNSCLHYIVKEDLQNLSSELGVSLTIAHYPAYCSKYNPIEHRLFCHIQRSWDGLCFQSYEQVQAQVEKTTTQTGLQVVAWCNDKIYQTARKYSEQFKQNMQIEFDALLPKWNYTIKPL